jgi:Predicted small integral membrane protein
LRSLNTWQLIINTITTIITFLLVALLQNSQRRVEDGMNPSSTRSQMVSPT